MNTTLKLVTTPNSLPQSQIGVVKDATAGGTLAANYSNLSEGIKSGRHTVELWDTF